MKSVNGGKITISVDKRVKCGTCKGTGAKPGTSPTKCSNCGGRGVAFIQRGFMSIQTTCPNCNGTGSVIKHKCTDCRGEGSKNESVEETINIPKGVDTGQNLRVAQKGHASESGGPMGDLLINVVVKPHPIFQRKGYDIMSDITIPVYKAVLGGSVDLDTLYGPVELKVNAGTNSGDKKRLSRYGVPHLPPNTKNKGNHYVSFKVKIPKNISTEERKIYEELRLEEGGSIDEDIGEPEQGGFFSGFKKFYS